MHRIYKELGLPGSKAKSIKVERLDKKYPQLKQN